MYMLGVGTSPDTEILRELAGARVLITGLTSSLGVDIARAFADMKTRLVVHTNDLSPEITALVALLSQSAREIKLFTNAMTGVEATIQFAQRAAQAYGGLDAVINLATITPQQIQRIKSDSDVDALVSGVITPLAHMTHVTANRMRVVFSEGMILNVLTMASPRNGREAAIASLARAALSAMTRSEAQAWADQAVRINAVAPRTLADGGQGATLNNEPDVAALAVYLASRRGKSLSGHIFDTGSMPA
jgi:3-oxoacyl-[acyl-carrier protein] reductase